MLAATSFHTQPIRPADNRAAPVRDDKSTLARKSGPSEAMRATVLKAAVTLLASENRTLQECLAAERRFSAELRFALEGLRQAANTDPLTGLHNRRAMDQHLDALWNGQDGAPLSVLMLDIDHFKRINDTYGHPCGDLVIRQVAETLHHCLRAEDSAFRYGGEEFMVLLPNTSMEGAVSVAESIRGRVEQLHMTHHDGGSMHCTVSLGVASRHAQEDCHSLFQRADRALYQAKQHGRNRVVHLNG
jgi:diguanylate cyclase